MTRIMKLFLKNSFIGVAAVMAFVSCAGSRSVYDTNYADVGFFTEENKK